MNNVIVNVLICMFFEQTQERIFACNSTENKNEANNHNVIKKFHGTIVIFPSFAIL